MPCYKRCREIEYTDEHEKVLEPDDAEGGWVDTHHFVNLNEQVQEMTLADQTPKPIPTKTTTADDDDDDDEEGGDMEEFVESGLIDEDDQAVVQPAAQASGGADEVPEDTIVPTRTYDLNITYDKYYQTPRLWLSGHDENHKPLSIQEMYDDISQDHAKKTVTMEEHPHISGPPMASVHPCR